MKNIYYIFIILPFLVCGQTIPDKKYHGGAEISKTYHGGVVVWSASPTNLYTLANAANPDNEVNATTGAASTGGAWSSVTTVPTPQNGSYSMKMTRGDAGVGNSNLITLSAIPTGVPLTITLYIYEGMSSAQSAVYLQTSRGWSSDVSYTVIPTGSWQLIELTATASSATPDINIYSGSGGQIGDWIAVDNVVITE